MRIESPSQAATRVEGDSCDVSQLPWLLWVYGTGAYVMLSVGDSSRKLHGGSRESVIAACESQACHMLLLEFGGSLQDSGSDAGDDCVVKEHIITFFECLLIAITSHIESAYCTRRTTSCVCLNYARYKGRKHGCCLRSPHDYIGAEGVCVGVKYHAAVSRKHSAAVHHAQPFEGPIPRDSARQARRFTV